MPHAFTRKGQSFIFPFFFLCGGDKFIVFTVETDRLIIYINRFQGLRCKKLK